ncbi:Coiled-coil domain-containing protein 81 [Argiope bruennichi]|uniref:Coiled-coil domain-containing protein 81 n=1 Tax=Argiope bruennichi TaxID=94029 RepID=A0A8T0FQ39_ARGBR|nr:Coiled-coil domain-containing protein 81 [Argiope bruennichi]
MKNNPKTFIGKRVTDEEAIKILQAVGEFIKNHLLQYFNVSFPGIGIFALSRQQLPVSHHPVKYIVSQKPVFQLSHNLASRYGLKWARIHYEGSIPFLPLINV